MIGTLTAGIAGLMAAGAAAPAVANIVGAKMQSNANKRASELAQDSSDAALEYEKENEARRREEFDRVEEENKRRWDIEANRDEYRWNTDLGDKRRAEGYDVSRYNAEQTRRQPYRDISLAAANDLAQRAGLRIVPGSAPQLAAPPPAPPPSYLADLAKPQEALRS